MSNDKPENKSEAGSAKIPVERFVRHFVFAMSGQDEQNNIQQGNMYFTSLTGKLTKCDVELAKKLYCEGVEKRSPGVELDPLKCMAVGMFEIDA